MHNLKLYVVEWDKWSFQSIHTSYFSAQSYSRNYMEVISVVDVLGPLVDNFVYLVIDGTGDWNGAYSSQSAAELVLKEMGSIGKDFCVRRVRLKD